MFEKTKLFWNEMKDSFGLGGWELEDNCVLQLECFVGDRKRDGITGVSVAAWELYEDEWFGAVREIGLSNSFFRIEVL